MRPRDSSRYIANRQLTPHTTFVNRDDAIARIKQIEPDIRAFGAAALYIFGSTARNEAKAASDVDVFIDRDPTKHVGFIELFEIEELLEAALGSPVDLCTRTALHPALRDNIEKSAIRVL